jgi:hypothetical protein
VELALRYASRPVLVKECSLTLDRYANTNGKSTQQPLRLLQVVGKRLLGSSAKDSERDEFTFSSLTYHCFCDRGTLYIERHSLITPQILRQLF